MSRNVKDVLEDEILRRCETLNMKGGNDDERSIERIGMLHDMYMEHLKNENDILKIENEKSKNDCELKMKSEIHDSEIDFKEIELKNKRRKDTVDIVISCVAGIGTASLWALGHIACLAMEKEGSITLKTAMSVFKQVPNIFRK